MIGPGPWAPCPLNLEHVGTHAHATIAHPRTVVLIGHGAAGCCLRRYTFNLAPRRAYGAPRAMPSHGPTGLCGAGTAPQANASAFSGPDASLPLSSPSPNNAFVNNTRCRRVKETRSQFSIKLRKSSAPKRTNLLSPDRFRPLQSPSDVIIPLPPLASCRRPPHLLRPRVPLHDVVCLPRDLAESLAPKVAHHQRVPIVGSTPAKEHHELVPIVGRTPANNPCWEISPERNDKSALRRLAHVRGSIATGKVGQIGVAKGPSGEAALGTQPTAQRRRRNERGVVHTQGLGPALEKDALYFLSTPIVASSLRYGCVFSQRAVERRYRQTEKLNCVVADQQARRAYRIPWRSQGTMATRTPQGIGGL